MPKAVRDNPEEYAELVVAQALKVAELRDGEPCVLVDHVHEQLGGGPKSTVTLPTLKRLRDRGVVEQYEDEQHRSWVRRIGDLPIVGKNDWHHALILSDLQAAVKVLALVMWEVVNTHLIHYRDPEDVREITGADDRMFKRRMKALTDSGWVTSVGRRVRTNKSGQQVRERYESHLLTLPPMPKRDG